MNTPLLVPSFSSSVGFEVQDILHKLQDQLTIASLVSAYDLWYERIDVDDIWYSKKLFIDSGVYENVTLNENSTDTWSLGMYEKWLNDMTWLNPDPILVSYDHIGTFEEQVHRTKQFFAQYPFARKDFLLKRPEDNAKTIDIDDLTLNIKQVRDFDILGVTEKELGRSMVERCQSILKIRRSLDASHLNTPIHVFGCLDPLCILSYFFCGADIFDGLVWLRHGFLQNLALHPRNFTIMSKQWEEYDDIPSPLMLVNNLAALNNLMFMMRRIVQNYDLADLKQTLNSDQFKQLTSLLKSAGIELEAN
jgi:hypothetical protein